MDMARATGFLETICDYFCARVKHFDMESEQRENLKKAVDEPLSALIRLGREPGILKKLPRW